jgi:hypothetical protein
MTQITEPMHRRQHIQRCIGCCDRTRTGEFRHTLTYCQKAEAKPIRTDLEASRDVVSILTNTVCMQLVSVRDKMRLF